MHALDAIWADCEYYLDGGEDGWSHGGHGLFCQQGGFEQFDLFLGERNGKFSRAALIKDKNALKSALFPPSLPRSPP